MANNEHKTTFRAYIWCPMNNGQMVIEFNRGDTIGNLLSEVRRAWGIDLPTSKTERGYTSAGWNVLGKTPDGSYVPLHVDDVIPSSPFDMQELMRPEGRTASPSAERNRFRWIVSYGLTVDVSGQGDAKERDEIFARMIPPRALRWPESGERADIDLCIVTAIIGG